MWLAGIARVVEDAAFETTQKVRVFYQFRDHLGSTSSIVDKATGDIVEHITYSAYGATESDYRNPKWNKYRESSRFGGNDDDFEVGLVYVGARYYAPGLLRWISPDPLTAHAAMSDSNPYAYVRGRVLSAVDPLGLEDAPAVYRDPDGYANGEVDENGITHIIVRGIRPDRTENSAGSIWRDTDYTAERWSP